MRELYIDFDGVLMDTIATSYRLLDERQIDLKDEAQVMEFYALLNWEDIIEISPILDDSIKRLHKIKASGKFHISVLTHVNSLGEIIEKVKFIRKYFHDITIIPCPKMISKTQMVDAKDAILIDDYSGNLQEWQKAGGIGIHFGKTHETDLRSIDHIDQILEMEF